MAYLIVLITALWPATIKALEPDDQINFEITAYQILLKEIYQTEYRIASSKSHQQVFTKDSLTLAWLGGYIAARFLQPFKNISESEWSTFLVTAKEYQVSESKLKQWLKLSSEELHVTYMERHPVSQQELYQPELDQWLKPKGITLNCHLSTPIKQYVEQYGGEKSMKSPIHFQSLTKNEVDCTALLITQYYQKSLDQTWDPQAWYELFLPLTGNQKTLALLATWKNLRDQQFSKALSFIFPLTVQHPRFRFAYESIQRIYQIKEKGEGSVALKNL